MDISLVSKKAFIGGASQGIGFSTALELAGLGATCILVARNPASLNAALARLPRPNDQAHRCLVADYDFPDQVLAAAHTALADGPVHILINNSGGPAAGPISAASSSSFTNAFQQHLINNHQLVQAFLPGMKSAGYGRVINVVSTSVRIPLPNLGVSNTIRAAVASWSKSMSNELGQFNITFNNVLPGLTDTARLQRLIQSIAQQQNCSPEEVRQGMIDSVPMKRFGLAEETAQLIAFLASPAAAYINGTSIPVDGGRTGTV